MPSQLEKVEDHIIMITVMLWNNFSLRKDCEEVPIYIKCDPEVSSAPIEGARKSALLYGISIDLICLGKCSFMGFKGYIQRGESCLVSTYRDGIL